MVKKHIPSDKLKKIWSEAFSKEAPVQKIYYSEMLVVCFFINLVMILAVVVLSYAKILPPQIPLFYGEPEGEGQLAANWMLTTPSAAAIIFLVVNTIISTRLLDEYLKKTLVIAAFSITILSIVTTFKIITLIGSF